MDGRYFYTTSKSFQWHSGINIIHYNDDGDHTEEERYDQFRLRDLGTTLLHGHTHSDQRVSRSSNGTLQIHVGLDAWGLKPVTLHQIKTIMEENNA